MTRLTTKNITKKQAQRLVKLLEREARCEVIARLGRIDNLDCVSYATKQIEYKDKIRRLLFGTDNIVELAELWGMGGFLGWERKKRKRARKTSNKKL